jgi:hyperosmotically inducible protein
MFRLLFRLMLLIVVLGVIAVFALGYRWSTRREETTAPVTAGGEVLNAERARRAGSDIAGKVAAGASRAGKVLEEGALTAKIKSKMALDDTIDASDVNVSTEGAIVTLRGTVVNRKQHQRVVQLAQETAGVTSVVDKLSVREGR